jgi:four helix bundle protein
LKEYLDHLSMARASLAEVKTHLEIAARLAYVHTEEVAHLAGNIGALSKQIYALRNALAAKAGVPIPDRLPHDQ